MFLLENQVEGHEGKHIALWSTFFFHVQQINNNQGYLHMNNITAVQSLHCVLSMDSLYHADSFKTLHLKT